MKPDLIEQCFKLIITEGLGLKLDDPNLSGTPKRMAKMYIDIFQNVGKEFPTKNLTNFPNEMPSYAVLNEGQVYMESDLSSLYDQLIVFDTIRYVSWCSHHFLPFEGLGWLGYIPGDCLVGASKPARLFDHYSKRPQMQETLLHDIIRRFDEVVKPRGTIVASRAIHACMRCRGVRKSGGMINSVVTGILKKDLKARSEAMDWIKISLMKGVIE
jgi:GTP cyclohydrolase I